MGRALEIRTDVAHAGELRRLARREGYRRTPTRMLAIAHAAVLHSSEVWAQLP